MKRKVEVTSQRVVHTYVELWHTSRCLLEMKKDMFEGAHHLNMGSLVFTAFTLEAYLNHIGVKIFNCWSDLEFLGPTEKLNVISEKVGFEVNPSIRPWQTIKPLFGFRNDIAHGKTKNLSISKIESLENHHRNPWGYRAQTKWEKYCTNANAERAREDVKAIIHLIHEAVKIPEDYPFKDGFEMGGANLLPD